MNKQITEDYCSFEIAKLLKEKGFKEITQGYINTDREVYMCPFQQGVYELGNKQFPYPTHQMALKWLREVHKIFVEPFVAIDLNGKYHYCFRLLNSICKDILEPKDLVRIDFKDTYEQAVEAAILYVLKNLI